ncbi:MAG: hypothetical protein R3264_06935 [Anaerolineae bacterium]|nr:hypothetical protein [Anaerolineae bacterium]
MKYSQEHTNIIEQISLWLDDELSSAEIGDLWTHLSTCQSCTESYHAMRRADQLIRQAAAVMVGPEPGFTARFETRLATYAPRRRWHTWAGASVLLLSSAGLLAILAVFGTLTALDLWSALVNQQLSYYLLAEIGMLFHFMRIALNWGGIAVQTALITMGQPIVWLLIPAAIGLSWLWVSLMKGAFSRVATTARLFA